MQPTQNLHVVQTVPLIAPAQLLADFPMTAPANHTVVTGREQVQRILAGADPRLMVVVGPCSIHDPEAALEYARRLARLAGEVRDRLFVIMRVYFEKPRTTVGWKGLINDPHLDDTFDIETGLRIARRLLLQINEMGLPAATEFLEPITPQYIADLVTLTAIGARTTESPTHRQMASGLSMPVGYKNGTDGNLQVALDAMVAAQTPHRFLGIDADGHTCLIQTSGNPWGFVILRGGRSGANYSAEHLRDAARRLREAGLRPRLMIDCSHANSEKDYRRQAAVWRDVLRQYAEGSEHVCGLMLESNLHPGNQKLTGGLKSLKYGVSITDGCIGWEETETLLRDAHALLRERVAV
ncbi:MAG TPA: 3-deoxy-7-phosphoheptulonate synthase [Gemmataceae bacterium]